MDEIKQKDRDEDHKETDEDFDGEKSHEENLRDGTARVVLPEPSPTYIFGVINNESD